MNNGNQDAAYFSSLILAILEDYRQQRRAAPSIVVAAVAPDCARVRRLGPSGLMACRPCGPASMHERASARGNLLKRASWQFEIKQHRKVRESGSHVLSNLHLRSCLGPFFCILEQLGGNQLTYVCFSTIRANLSRHAFHYHCQATALKSNCCCAWLSRSFFADNAFHEILFLQSGSHSEGSGS